MDYQRRVARWVVGGLCQHLLLWGFGALAALAVVTAVVGVFGSIALRTLSPLAEHHFDRLWAESFAPLSTVVDRYSNTSTNPSARSLEAIAADMGIELASATETEASRPGQNASDDFAAVREELLDLDIILQAETPAPPSSVARWLVAHRESIVRAADLILSREAPVWANGLASCAAAPDTSLEGHIWLQRVLLVAAGRALALGDPATAERILEASWRFDEGLLASPQLAAHLAASEIVELQMRVLRHLPDPSDHWNLRLAALDLERNTLEAYRYDAWRLHCVTGKMMSESQPMLGFVVQPFAGLLAIHQHEAMRVAIAELPRRDMKSFDPDAFVAEQHEMVPRWNTLSRSSLPTSWESWPRSIRAALDVELATLVLELRRTARQEGSAAIEQLPDSIPTRVAGFDWDYLSNGDRVTIALDGEPIPGIDRPPLQSTIRLGPRTAMRGAR